MYRLEFLKIAKEDMSSIVYYISHELKNKNAAYHLVNDFEKEMNLISNFPYSNPEYIPFHTLKYKYRVSKVKNYIIFYVINEQEKLITVARILYGKRSMEKTLE